MSAVLAAKKATRSAVRTALRGLSQDEKSKQSSRVMEKLLSLPEYTSAASVSVYLSFGIEVDTARVVDQLLASPDRRCFVPKIYPATGEMKFLSLPDRNTLSAWPTVPPFNIVEAPDDYQAEEALDVPDLDAVLVPCLAFTRDGRRLGKGKGYYDRYLAKMQQRFAAVGRQPPMLIGLAFSCQILPDLPVDQSDIPVDIIVHPDGVERCSDRCVTDL